VQRGVDEGEFVVCQPRLVSLGLLSTQEGMQKRFRYQSRHRSSRRRTSFVYEAYEAEESLHGGGDVGPGTCSAVRADLARIQRLASEYRDF